MLARVGAGLLTVKPFVSVAVPPPGLALVTDTFRVPVAAVEPIVMLAVIWVELSTVVVLTLSLHDALPIFTPVMKLVPVKTTSSVWPRLPLVGLMLARVGAGLLTVKPFV